MSSFFQPLRDVYADTVLDGELPAADGERSCFPHGEVGGVVFSGDRQLERYQHVGGAVYQPLLPFGNCATAVADDRVAHRLAARNAGGKSVTTTLGAVVRSVLSATAFPLCPILRSVVPRQFLDIVGTPTLADERTRDVKRCDDAVVAMAFHWHLPVLAVATRDAAKAHRIQLYDVAQEATMPLLLTHAFQTRGIHALAWKPLSRDCLAVGCDGGVLCWSMSAGTASKPRRGGQQNDAQHPYGPLWGHLADSDPMAVWYECSPYAPVSTLVFSSNGRYVACASEHSISMHLHDISAKPRDSLIMESVAVEGGTCSLCFSRDDDFLVRAIRHQRCIKLMSTTTFCVETIQTEAPVTRAVALQGTSVFLLQYAKTEGVALVRFHMNAKPGTKGDLCAVMIVLGMVSTGICRGVGGAVLDVAVDGKRVFLRLKSGHILSMSSLCADGHSWAIRGVGVIPPPSTPSPATCMATSPSFHKGSLLATTYGHEVRFFPAYYAR